MATLSLNVGANALGDDAVIASYNDVPNGYTFGVDAITPIDNYLAGVSCLEKDVDYGDMVSPIISSVATFEKESQAGYITTVLDEHYAISSKTAHNEDCCKHVANSNDVFSAIAVMMRWAAVLVMILIMAGLVLL